MDNLIEIREINKLIKENFYIPSYQRGFRWDEKQVKDLLDDIYEFIHQSNQQEGDIYCLQPIVILRRGERCVVIDGQQRLTTIMIIQKYLHGETYSIEYSKRKGSKEYLDNIIENATNDDIKAKNIDYYFMQRAYKVIKKWFEQKINENEEFTLNMDFYVTLGKKCKVIWYEVKDGVNEESIFTRLNIGKIPLTNAELIKALLLSSNNIDVEDNIIYLRKLEIANEWDNIENTLQDEKFWYFINPKINNMPTRIEYIFDSISQKTSDSDDYFTFRYFNDLLQKKSTIEVWNEKIKPYFQILNEWYKNHDLYHFIGYLIASGYDTSVASLINSYKSENYKKSEFIGYIKSLIKDSLRGIDINELEYITDNNNIKNILLLFNVLTTMKTNDFSSIFPFDSYVKNFWSLEHIHAQQAEGLNKKELWVSWIDEHIKSFNSFTDDRYKKIVEDLKYIDKNNITREQFENLFESIKVKIKDDYGVDLHSINNLALLDRDTNSSLSNAFFDVKRTIILERDRQGSFIPICTRYVFLKYYSKDSSQIHYWSETDRYDYLERIKLELSEYLPNGDDKLNG